MALCRGTLAGVGSMRQQREDAECGRAWRQQRSQALSGLAKSEQLLAWMEGWWLESFGVLLGRTVLSESGVCLGAPNGLTRAGRTCEEVGQCGRVGDARGWQGPTVQPLLGSRHLDSPSDVSSGTQ